MPKAPRPQPAPHTPEWVGVVMLLGALLASGWMVVATLSLRAWVVGFVATVLFIPTLLITIGHFFPEDRTD